jgi:hypothetical protein
MISSPSFSERALFDALFGVRVDARCDARKCPADAPDPGPSRLSRRYARLPRHRFFPAIATAGLKLRAVQMKLQVADLSATCALTRAPRAPGCAPSHRYAFKLAQFLAFSHQCAHAGLGEKGRNACPTGAQFSASVPCGVNSSSAHRPGTGAQTPCFRPRSWKSFS